MTPEKDHGTSILEEKFLDKSLNIFSENAPIWKKKSGKI